MTTLESGEPTPDRPDGTAIRAPGGGTVLVTNHEITAPGGNPVPAPAGLVYDPGASAAPRRSRWTARQPRARVRQPRRHPQQLRRRRDAVGHLAHLRGDRGRPDRDERPPQDTATSSRSTPTTASNRNPQPIKALGRFAHEAVVVDPETGTSST